jgi:hypothetical protein
MPRRSPEAESLPVFAMSVDVIGRSSLCESLLNRLTYRWVCVSIAVYDNQVIAGVSTISGSPAGFSKAGVQIRSTITRWRDCAALSAAANPGCGAAHRLGAADSTDDGDVDVHDLLFVIDRLSGVGGTDNDL